MVDSQMPRQVANSLARRVRCQSAPLHLRALFAQVTPGSPVLEDIVNNDRVARVGSLASNGL